VAKVPAQLSLGFSAEDFAAEEDDAELATSAEDNKGFSISSRRLSSMWVDVRSCGSHCIQNGCSAHRKQEGLFFSGILPENCVILTVC
jgi:hypothetical protein